MTGPFKKIIFKCYCLSNFYLGGGGQTYHVKTHFSNLIRTWENVGKKRTIKKTRESYYYLNYNQQVFTYNI